MFPSAIPWLPLFLSACLQLPYITSPEEDMPSYFATTPMCTPSLSLMQAVLTDPLQSVATKCTY